MTDLRNRYIDWERERSRLTELEDHGGPPPGDWHLSDDDAVELLREAMLELERRSGEHVICLPRFGYDLHNEDRAAMVAPLIAAFAQTYYCDSEMIDVVVSDFLADLMHFWDRTQMIGLAHIGTVDDYTDDAPLPEFESLVETAGFHYRAEVDEEAEEAHWRAEEEDDEE